MAEPEVFNEARSLVNNALHHRGDDALLASKVYGELSEMFVAGSTNPGLRATNYFKTVGMSDGSVQTIPQSEAGGRRECMSPDQKSFANHFDFSDGSKETLTFTCKDGQANVSSFEIALPNGLVAKHLDGSPAAVIFDVPGNGKSMDRLSFSLPGNEGRGDGAPVLKSVMHRNDDGRTELLELDKK